MCLNLFSPLYFIPVIKNQCSFPGWSELYKTWRIGRLTLWHQWLPDTAGTTTGRGQNSSRGSFRDVVIDLRPWVRSTDTLFSLIMLWNDQKNKWMQNEMNVLFVQFVQYHFHLPERLKEDSWRSRTPCCTRLAWSPLLGVSPSMGPKPSSFFIELATLATSPE